MKSLALEIPTSDLQPYLHDVSYPEGFIPAPIRSGDGEKPAKEFSFKLDAFQSRAIKCLEDGESVMASAHSPADKQVIALYAIAMSLRDHERIIYTSPIKEIVNQKYTELKHEFSDVGLMTGDATLDPKASCLVMTTEILRNMQYKEPEFMREVAWIVFDDVHYMRDKERGFLLEESIIMSPQNSHFVFLSATVPNAKEFADWVAKVHQQACHIVYAEPTPLEHYIYPTGSCEMHLAVDREGDFREGHFQRGINALVQTCAGKKRKRCPEQQNLVSSCRYGKESDIFKLVEMLIIFDYDPVLVFSTSGSKCEFLAVQMGKLCVNVCARQAKIETIFKRAIERLPVDEKKLPQVSSMLRLLKRGFGVHHSGLLPILREVVETLFRKGHIKCLFATETFTIGLNIPAQTVVFADVRKFDGDKFRWISSGEYIQMSAHAGRRGIDEYGMCVAIIEEKMEPSAAKMMLRGPADSLNSAFHLSYNTLLNQMCCEHGDPEKLLQRSFYQFQSDRAYHNLNLEKQAKELEHTKDPIVIEELGSICTGTETQAHDMGVGTRPFQENEGTDRQVDQLCLDIHKDGHKDGGPLEALLRLTKCGSLLLNPVENTGVPRLDSYREAVRRMKPVISDNQKIWNAPLIPEKLTVFRDEHESAAQIKLSKRALCSSTELIFNGELKARKQVLQQLGYITSEGVIELKGKVACEISTVDELTLTELMFNGVLKDAKMEEMVALLSCFVWQEELKEAQKPRKELEFLFSQLQETARKVANVELECKVSIDVANFVSSFRHDIMEAVYAWAKGSKFYQIMKIIPRVFDANLIRAIRRLEEVLRQLIVASRSIGETQLELKFEAAIARINRGVVSMC